MLYRYVRYPNVGKSSTINVLLEALAKMEEETNSPVHELNEDSGSQNPDSISESGSPRLPTASVRFFRCDKTEASNQGGSYKHTV